MIYVIEDDELKARRITNFLADKYPEKAVELYRSYNSGLRAIEQRAPELILLDMSLPTFDSIHGNREGRPRPYGGRDLMRKLKRKHISTKVIIVTGLEGFGEGDSRQTLPELTKQCNEVFGDMFVGSVYYHPTRDDWQEEILRMLNQRYMGGEAQ